MVERELTDALRQSIGRAGLCWFASADGDGLPCIAPKELFAPLGNSVVFADTNETRCSGNVRVRPEVCLSIFDWLTGGGFSFLARVRVIEPGDDDYRAFDDLLREVRGPDHPIGVIYEARVIDYEAVPVPVLRRHPYRSRREMIADTWAPPLQLI